MYGSMKQTMIRKVAVLFTLFTSLTVVNSCVNDKYELSEERLDMTASIFQEGLSLPLGSTGKMRMDSLINKMGLPEDFKKFLSPDADGAYALGFHSDAPIDMSESLKSLTGLVDLKKIDFSQSIGFSLANVNAADLSFEGFDINVEESLSDKFGNVNIAVPQINNDFEIDAALREHSSELSGLELKVDFGAEEHFTEVHLASLDSKLEVPSGLLENQKLANTNYSISEISRMVGRSITIKGVIEEEVVESYLEYEFPKEVKSISDLHVAEGAKLKVAMRLEDPFFISGSVVPHVDLNLGDILHLADKDGAVHDDHIDSDFILSAENGWAAEGEYDITGIVLDNTKDWKYAVNSNGETVLWLDKTIHTKVSGTLVDNGLKTSLSYLDNWLDRHGESREVMVDVSLTLENFVIDDATLELNPIAVETESSFDVNIPQVTLPKEIVSVGEVAFSDASVIDLNLAAQGLSNIGDLFLNVEAIEVTFPSRMKVEGTDQNNMLVIPGGDLSTSSLSRQIKLQGIRLDQPDENGIIPAVSEPVKVKVRCITGGELHTANLPKTQSQDVKLIGNVAASIDIADYSAVVSGFSINSVDNPDLFASRKIKVEVPEQMASVQGLAVRFKNDPAISLDIDVPAISAGIGPVGQDGLVIRFPDMLQFKSQTGLQYLEWFDPVRNALVFPEGKALPDMLSLPVDCLIVNPVKDETDGKYYASGDIQIIGGVGIKAGSTITKADIDVLSKPGTKFAFNAVIPSLEVDGVSMEAYSSTIEKTIEFAPLKSVTLPEQLTYVGAVALDDTYLSITMKAGDDFPDLGKDAVLSLGLDITLPDFIKVDDPRYANGKLSVLGVLEKQSSGKMEMVVEPVRIGSIDVDRAPDALAGLKGNIGIVGNVNISGAALDMDQWLGGKTHKLDFAVGIASMKDGQSTGKIDVNEITAKLDYQAEPMDLIVDMSSLAEVLNADNISATIDLATFYVSLGLNTNLGIPMAADLAIVPYYGGEAGAPVERKIKIQGADSSDDMKQTILWLSNKAPAEGTCDQFVDVDLVSLLYKDEQKTTLLDSLKLSLKAGVDAEQMCVYDPSAEYQMSFDYAAGLPLAFGDKFEIVYKATIDEIPAELGQIAGYGGAIGLGGEIENSLPFNVTVTANICDSQGNRIGGTSTDGPLVKSADALGKAVKTNLNMIVEVDKNAPVDDISSIQLELKVDTKNAPGVPLREGSYIKVNRLYARIPKGITLDLSKLLSEEEGEGENN